MLLCIYFRWLTEFSILVFIINNINNNNWQAYRSNNIWMGCHFISFHFIYLLVLFISWQFLSACFVADLEKIIYTSRPLWSTIFWKLFEIQSCQIMKLLVLHIFKYRPNLNFFNILSNLVKITCFILSNNLKNINIKS